MHTRHTTHIHTHAHITPHMHLTRKGPTFTPQQRLHYPLLRGLHHFLACPMQGYACSEPEGQLATRAVVPVSLVELKAGKERLLRAPLIPRGKTSHCDVNLHVCWPKMWALEPD